MILEAHDSLTLLNSENSQRFSICNAAATLPKLVGLAQEYRTKQLDAQHGLAAARLDTQRIAIQLDTVCKSLSREMLNQYHCVLAYANYLEEHIARHAATPDLRYDFDDISESACNLKLIASSLDLSLEEASARSASINISLLIQRILIALSACLDRRNMTLTTLEVDENVIAHACPSTSYYVLWMILLGTIRYAAGESTLRLRCLYSHDKSRVILSIVISELSPGRLSETERASFLSNQAANLSPHLFADTIATHANIQLASMLLEPLRGTLSVLALTSHSCEICIKLPTHST